MLLYKYGSLFCFKYLSVDDVYLFFEGFFFLVAEDIT